MRALDTNVSQLPKKRHIIAVSNDLVESGPHAWAKALILIVLAVLTYSPLFHAGFIWDDDQYVTHNWTLHSVEGLKRIWIDLNATPQYYPLVHTTFWIEYHLWQLEPLGYHLVNIVLHIASALMLWRLLLLLKVQPGVAWMTGLLFAVHPVQVESVAWITERKNALSGLFYFAAMTTYFRFEPMDANQSSRRWGFYALSIVFFIAALLSKTVTCTLPAAILILIWWKRGAVRWRDLATLVPMLVLGLAMGGITAHLEKSHVMAVGPDWNFSSIDRILIAGRAVWFYASKLIVPYPLIFIYPRWDIRADVFWQYLFPAGVLFALIGLWLLRQRTGRGPLAAVLIFIVTLVPALGFVNVYPMRFSFVADHFQYLAMAPLLVLLLSVPRLVLQNQVRLLHVAAALMILAAVAISWNQCHIYYNKITLWRDVLAKNPTCWMAQTNLCIALDAEGITPEGLEHAHLAVELHPDWQSYTNLSVALARRGQYTDALAQIHAALQTNPEHPVLHELLAQTWAQWAAELMSSGHEQAAIADYEQALRVDPNRIDALNNLAWALATRPHLRSRSQVALRFAQRALVMAREPSRIVASDSPEEAQLDEDAAPKQPIYAIMDTLAAAYAATGDFQSADQTAENAANLAEATGHRDDAEDIRRRQHLYQQGDPYDEAP